MVDAPRPPVGT